MPNALGVSLINDKLSYLVGNKRDDLSRIEYAKIRHNLGKFNWEIPVTDKRSTIDIQGLDKLIDCSAMEFIERAGNEDFSSMKSALIQFFKDGLVERPDEISIQPGWTRYEASGLVESVPWPLEKIILCDCETLVQLGGYPVMAGAYTNQAWYLWLHPSLMPNSSGEFKPEMIPMGQDKLIVNFAVKFDTGKMAETYDLGNTNFVFDLQSAHISVCGMSSKQRDLFRAYLSGSARHHEEWFTNTSANSLIDTYNLHVRPRVPLKKEAKDIRNIFVIASGPQVIKDSLDRLIQYTLDDVEYTYKLGQALLPKYFHSNPHIATFAGHLILNQSLLPVQTDWKKWIAETDKIWAEKTKELEQMLCKIAKDIAVRFRDGLLTLEQIKVDPWLNCLDWTPAKSGKNTGMPLWWRKCTPAGRVTTKSRVAPYLLGLKIHDTPMVFIPKKAWCYEVAGKQPGAFQVSASSHPLGKAGWFMRVPHKKGCLPWWTNVLTSEGWKHLDEIQVGDKVLGETDGTTNWTRVTKVVDAGLMDVWKYSQSNFELQATANHRWLIKPRKRHHGKEYDGPLEYRAELQIADRHKIIHNLPFTGESNLEVTLDECKMLGLLLGDGSIGINSASKKFAHLTQSNFVEECRQLVYTLNPEATEVLNGTKKAKPHHKQGYRWLLHVGWTKQFLAKFGMSFESLNWSKAVLGLSQSQIRAFLDGVYLAEGHKTAHVKQFSQCRVANPEKYEALQIACVLSGQHWTNPKGNGQKCFSLNKNNYSVNKKQLWSNQGPQEVGCLVTEAGSFFIEQNGCMTLTGNSTQNVGNPLGRDYIAAFEDGVMTARNEEASKFMKLASNLTYWTAVRKRVFEQISWPLKGTNMLAIEPQLAAHGTTSRRCVERLWLTLSSAGYDSVNPRWCPGATGDEELPMKADKKTGELKVNCRTKPYPKVGAELKSRVQAPEGWVFVGADFDQQEMKIASGYSDAYEFMEYGATSMGITTIMGDKKKKTDNHSLLADFLGVVRDIAKTMNFQMLYLCGVKALISAIKKVRADWDDAYCEQIAKKAIKLRRGTKDRTTKMYKGGTDSAAYNFMLRLGNAKRMPGHLGHLQAQHKLPRTPLLQSAMSSTITEKLCAGNYLTSRANWGIQSSGADILHCSILVVRYLAKIFDVPLRFMFSIHDEGWFLVKEGFERQAAALLQLTSLIVWSAFFGQLGFESLPESYAWFSAVNIDTCLRKEVYMSQVTVSNPVDVPKGYELNPEECADILNGMLSKL